jgi:hypothetical protein
VTLDYGCKDKVTQIRLHPLTSSIHIVICDLQCNLFGE